MQLGLIVQRCNLSWGGNQRAWSSYCIQSLEGKRNKCLFNFALYLKLNTLSFFF
ncbi:rCG29072, partial [Rattus norvegicus]